MTDSTYSVTFRLYDAAAGGALLWDETQPIMTSAGLSNVLLGSVTPVTDGDFAADAYLSIQVNPDPEFTTRTRIASVGYAFQAGNADKLDGLDSSELLSPLGEPTGRFRCFSELLGTTVTMCQGASVLREITSIYGSGGSGSLSIFVAGEKVITMRFYSTAINHFWTANGGAGILVQPGQIVEASSVGEVQVLMTGFEY